MDSYIYIILIFSLVLAFAVILQMNKKSAAPVIITPENPGSEKIYVPFYRVILLTIVFFFIGAFSILLGIMFRESGHTLSIMNGAFIAAGCFLSYQGLKLFIRRNRVLQLELTLEGIYYKPLKWYSYGRGGINPLSIYFAKDWCFSAYKELNMVLLNESTWVGDSIYIVTKTNESIKLLFFIDNKAQIAGLYKKIKSRIPENEFYPDLESTGKSGHEQRFQ